MHGNRFYTDDIIRIYVGELIKDSEGTLWLISGMKQDGTYRFINMGNGYPEEHTWSDFKFYYYPIERVRKLKGIDLLEGEDWLCHDKRCYPGVLADGCTGLYVLKISQREKEIF